MGLYTIGLIDRCIEKKELVLTIIAEILKILKNPKDKYNDNLPSHLGRALLQFSDGAGSIGERRKLAELLNNMDMKQYFSFKSHKLDKGKPGQRNAEKFLQGKQKWLARAGYL